MKLPTRLERWYRRWVRRQASKRQGTTLREFVYLDEASVYSLIASRLGPIATDFTETETASLRVEAASTIGGSAEIGSQVLRKSIIQTTFKELYELEESSFAIRHIGEHLKPPSIYDLSDPLAGMDTPTAAGWIMDPEKLVRGQLLEVEVQLEAESIFRVNAVVSALLEIIEEVPEVFGLTMPDALAQVRSVSRILGKLLTGLVPIRGIATEYSVVSLGDKEWIVHQRLLSTLPASRVRCTRPLCVVGVAEESLFWKDIRRVLFTRARYRALCRVGQDGLQDSWTPVKLAHVLDSLAPDLGHRVSTAGSDLLASITRSSIASKVPERKQQLIRFALVRYAMLLAGHYGISVTEQDLSGAGLPSEQHCAAFSNLKERREAFDEIAAFVLARSGLERDPSVVAGYREMALADADMDLSGQPTSLVAPVSAPLAPSPKERFLDTEFVAIYW